MNRGTRRMWTRRVLKAGWLLAPVLNFLWEIPKGIFRYFFGTKDRIIWTMVLGSLASFVTSCTVWQVGLDKTATPAQIKQLITENPNYAYCLKQYVPARQVQQQRAVSIRDLEIAKEQCEAAVKQAEVIAAQRAAVK